MGESNLRGRGCPMGKKPVFGLAGLLLAGAVLTGCWNRQVCHNGTCGDKGHMAVGQQGFNQPPARTVGQQMGSGTTIGQQGVGGMGSGTSQFNNMPGNNMTGTPGLGSSDSFRRSPGSLTGRPVDSSHRPGTLQPIGTNPSNINNVPGSGSTGIGSGSGISQPLHQGPGLQGGGLTPRENTSGGIGIPQGNHLQSPSGRIDGPSGVQISPPSNLGGGLDATPPPSDPVPSQP